DQLRGEVARVGFLQQAHPRIAPQLRIHLPVTGIDRNHFGCAVLQKAVSKPTSGRANIHASSAVNVDSPVLQRPRQFQSAPADEGKVVTKNANLGFALDAGARFLDLLLVHQNAPGEDQRLRTLARRRQATPEHELVEPGLHAARLARAKRARAFWKETEPSRKTLRATSLSLKRKVPFSSERRKERCTRRDASFSREKPSQRSDDS